MAWKIILGIVLFFTAVLLVKVKITVHSENGVSLSAGWLFLKFNILPKKELSEKQKKKKEEKEKKKKEKAARKKAKEEEKNKDAEKDETVKEPKAKKDNPFVKFYRNNGVSGVVELLQRLVASLKSGFMRVGRAFVFDELFVSLLVGTGDSAQTAEKYGKTCAAVFPAMGFITTNMRVKKYSVDVNPDFAYGNNNARLHVTLSFRPLRLINAFTVTGASLVFKVLIKFLRGLKAKKPAAKEEKINATK